MKFYKENPNLGIVFNNLKQIEESVRNQDDYIINGSNILLGSEIIQQFSQKIGNYKHILEFMCKTKDKAVNNAEFIINVLDHPILKISEDNTLENPFQDYLNDNSGIIQIDTNTLPILGAIEKETYLDIAIPSSLDWDLCNNDMTFYNCNKSIEIPTVEYNKLLDLVGIIINLDGSATINKRKFIIESINKIQDIISDESGNEYDFGLDIYLHNMVLNNTINDNIVSYTNIDDNLQNLFEYEDIDKFPIDAKILFYIDGFTSDDILTLLVKSNGLLVMVKTDNNLNLWYQKLLTWFGAARTQEGGR